MHAFRRSLRQGVDALRHVNERLDHATADRVVDALVHCTGRRYFTGVGKSGLVAARMASSLSSIGLASHWVHGSEWAHGELGSLRRGDLVTAVSHSGGTAELVWLVEQLEQRGELTCGKPSNTGASRPEGVRLVALTGNGTSSLARRASLALTSEVPPGSEALDLLPTSSVVAAHHVFNALMCECAARMDLTPADIARNHPGGAVGRHAAERLTGVNRNREWAQSK